MWHSDGVDVVTILQDQLNDVSLLQLRGAVVLPRGTVVDCADGTTGLVRSLRLIAPSTSAEPARLVAYVLPVVDRRSDPSQ